ncbi:hypothetical protein LXL04_038167 [Taraxacum kok-saghyz]
MEQIWNRSEETKSGIFRSLGSDFEQDDLEQIHVTKVNRFMFRFEVNAISGFELIDILLNLPILDFLFFNLSKLSLRQFNSPEVLVSGVFRLAIQTTVRFEILSKLESHVPGQNTAMATSRKRRLVGVTVSGETSDGDADVVVDLEDLFLMR